MARNSLIFPSSPRQRIIGHLSFWAFFTLHFFTQNLIVGTANEALHPRTPLEALINISYFLPIYILSGYTFVYFVIPRFLFKHRYGHFILATIALLGLNFFACYYAGVLYEHREWKMPYSQITFATNKYHAVVNGGFVSVMVLGIGGGLRFAREWWQKQRENEAIQQQKIASELQLLKIQINPRFLFHSLSTVKQNILAGSPQSPQLILQVADLLSYILYESDRDYIPLQKELAMIETYLSLEENSAEVSGPIVMDVSGKVNDKEIVPLMLLSVTETAFEYFLEKKQKLSAGIKIDIADDQIRFVLKAKELIAAPQQAEEKFSGIKKQLTNVYGSDHQFRIEHGSEETTIDLGLPLRVEGFVSNKQTASSFEYETE